MSGRRGGLERGWGGEGIGMGGRGRGRRGGAGVWRGRGAAELRREHWIDIQLDGCHVYFFCNVHKVQSCI